VTLLTRIREQIVPITTEGVIFALGYFTFTKMPPRGTAGEIFAWFLLLVAFCVVFSICPLIAIIYGWLTGNRAGAILLGILPLPILCILRFVMSWRQDVSPGDLSGPILYVVVLSGICGLAGYCAAQKTKSCLAVSVILTGLWLIIWMNGFN
jgi:hypothetical protein